MTGQEEWREICTAPGYWVSNLGRCKSRYRVLSFKKESQRKDGTKAYRRCTVAGKDQMVHVLVAIAFHGLPTPGYTVVHHKDGDRHNNTPSNLEWTNQVGNIRAAFRSGTHKGAKLKPADIHAIRRDYGEVQCYYKLARKYGVTYATIYRVINRQTWAWL